MAIDCSRPLRDVLLLYLVITSRWEGEERGRGKEMVEGKGREERDELRLRESPYGGNSIMQRQSE